MITVLTGARALGRASYTLTSALLLYHYIDSRGGYDGGNYRYDDII